MASRSPKATPYGCLMTIRCPLLGLTTAHPHVRAEIQSILG